ncbi:hypothetical protein H310_13031 [Aphanomyces invadans]|uniref:OTU domain-containing protein n=1 Tax=Aphanomyces invadans TaxID=157072 RepID=A0A024TFN3_9STRA|nr:hypothetical protein H310_13031 [Aphanomyces invadans]ETV92824.1 hypothetical protein H310_13031 [Aphanomyces invadans]|eukprot:XP_008878594.1 hypothetical protein H310_13031 [Aphanomyces invadans]
MGREAKKAKAKAQRAAASKKKAGRGSSGAGTDVHAIRQELAKRGCQLVSIEADGNCLFRTLSDQIYGDQVHFASVRQRIVAHIQAHRDDLEPFLEDEEEFDHYCRRMADDGVWGGNLELFAAAQVWQCNIVVHQVDGKCTTIECGSADARSFHVCYYNDEHYDSIRSLDDDLTGPPIRFAHESAAAGKICVEIAPEVETPSKHTALARLAMEFPHTSEDDLVDLYKKLHCDVERVRRKLTKQAAKSRRK